MLPRFIPPALGLCALSAFFACTTDEPPPGQLVLAVQTDMSLPEDVDKVRIEILSFGNVQFANDYDVGPDGLHIPATLGILAGKDPSSPVTIRVLSRRQGELRTLREVVTTVPGDRTATLRVPIQWLCDDLAEETGGGVKSKCPAKQTCVAGRCVDKNLDSASLPDYRAEDVFGGADGPGKSGQCFDTVPCFAEGFAAQVDESDCTIALPGSNADSTNVAIVTAKGGGGICGSQSCLVPLDAHSDAGWQEKDGRIALPEAVCQRLDDGRALAVALTTACEPKTEGIPTCGPWSSVTPSEGSFDGKAPRGVLDAGMDGPSVETRPDVAVDMPPDAAGVSALIGPEGGTLTSADGVLTVDIPPGAVEQEFTLTIDEAFDAPGGSLGQVYDVGPDGQQFADPGVTITYDLSRLDTAFEITDALQLASLDPAGDGGWVPLMGSMLDRASLSVTGTTTHFTLFGLVEGAGQCVTTEQVAQPVDAALYLMIDSSMSMLQAGGTPGSVLWDEMYTGLSTFLSDPATASTRVALKLYNDTAAGVCTGAAFSLPDIPAGDPQSTLGEIDLPFVEGMPTGNPTLQGPLEGLVGFAQDYAAANPGTAVAGVLYSAGPPSGVCETSDALLVEPLAGSGVPVFTIAAGNADTTILQGIGTASGTVPPFSGNTADEIATSLSTIRDLTQSCVRKVDPSTDLSLFQPVLDQEGSQTPLARVADPDACGDTSGWYELAPGLIGLCPAACASLVTDGLGGQVLYQLGCPPAQGGSSSGGGRADAGSGGGTTTDAGPGDISHDASVRLPLTYDDCVSTFGATECASCACESCLTELDDCNATGQECLALVSCIETTGCTDTVSCNQTDTCSGEIAAAGGPSATPVTAAFSAATCAAGFCSGVCGQSQGTNDASAPADPCPPAMPSFGSPCSSSGQTCDYGSSGFCTCDGSFTWQCAVP